MRELGVTKDAQTGRQEHAETENSRERTRHPRLASLEETDHTEEADIYKEKDGERHTIVSSGITEHCNRLESHQLSSAQVGLAVDFLAVSLPTTAHGNMILQQTQNNPRRSHLAGFGRKRNNRFKFPRGFKLA